MEKVIEHRPTLEKFKFWNRRAVPQSNSNHETSLTPFILTSSSGFYRFDNQHEPYL